MRNPFRYFNSSQEVIRRVEGNSEKVAVVCHWAGGHQTGAIPTRSQMDFDSRICYRFRPEGDAIWGIFANIPPGPPSGGLSGEATNTTT